MLTIGLIREGKIPADNRVALTPSQCKWVHKNSADVRIVVQSCSTRCFTDREYQLAGVEVREDMSDCDILFGIKEVPVSMLLPGKTYLFFSHTKKKQAHNQPLFHSLMEKGITLIDYECLEHDDGQRIIGFGFFCRHCRRPQRHDGLWPPHRPVHAGQGLQTKQFPRTDTYVFRAPPAQCKDCHHRLGPRWPTAYWKS